MSQPANRTDLAPPDNWSVMIDTAAPAVPSGRHTPVSWAASPATRRTMQANRGRDTEPEMKVRRLLHASGLRYRVNYRIPTARRRTIDIAFTGAMVACFIDGCFWHGCPQHFQLPRANAAYWKEKIGRNQERDVETASLLSAAGWSVLRFWEHEEVPAIASTIQRSVRASRLGPLAMSKASAIT